MHYETIKTYNIGRVKVTIDAVASGEGSQWFNDLYTVAAHKGGKTIAAPSHLTRGETQHYIGQTTPSELSSYYRAQGMPNPCKEAYRALQKEMEHYINAEDYSLRATVNMAGVKLSESWGITFDWSGTYDDDVQTTGAEMLKTHGYDFVHEAIDTARDVRASLV